MNIVDSKYPLVVICGGTGTGKSKLAIDIANHFNGEVINADALQIYKGMDIATNKVTESECRGIKHHLLGFKGVETLDYTIHDFQNAALEKIFDLKNEKKMPVLVGGTNYYIESVLWHKLVNVNSLSTSDLNEKFNSMNNTELHEYLRSLDPQTALLLHPNARRKVKRAIEIAVNSSTNQFDHLESQNRTRRFALNDTVFIWVNSEKEQLFPRLEKRVEEMVAGGLLEELQQIQEIFLRVCQSQTYTQGIFQAIGFKEFHEYLNYTDKESDVGKRILSECVERLKVANKKYVRVQNKWIKNRFLKEIGEERNIPLFKLDSSDVSKWNENVFHPSLKIIDQIMNSEHDTQYSSFVKQLHVLPETLGKVDVYTPCNKVCNACNNQLFITQQSWNAHIKSRRHAKMSKKLRSLSKKLIE